jgi:myo-inositol-1-phosphate synthase
MAPLSEDILQQLSEVTKLINEVRTSVDPVEAYAKARILYGILAVSVIPVLRTRKVEFNFQHNNVEKTT